MSKVYGKVGPQYTIIPKLVEKLLLPISKFISTLLHHHYQESRFSAQLSKEFRRRIDMGEKLYLLGITPCSHNTGVALVECSSHGGIRLLLNNEEERFSGVKNTSAYPEYSIDEFLLQLKDLNLKITDIFGVLSTWDYPSHIPYATKLALQHFPMSLLLIRKESGYGALDPMHSIRALQTPKRLAKQFGVDAAVPMVAMNHHKNHAYFAYAASPFSNDLSNKTLVSVIDGSGDAGSITMFLSNQGRLEILSENKSTTDSLGILYGILSSTQGGWPIWSSEGRYMGAAAWGDVNRMTNTYYRRLRSIIHLEKEGQVFVNRKMIRYHLGGKHLPYAPALKSILGEPIALKDMWNPDAVLNVDDVEHATITADRVDKAAALQMVFEDALFHVIDFWIKKTGSNQLVLSGGTALNCVANMRLMEEFNEAYYMRYLQKKTQLQIWIPPIPGDAGVAPGAAFQFAMLNGLRPGSKSLPSPYLCGRVAGINEISNAFSTFKSKENPKESHLNRVSLGNINNVDDLHTVAKIMAYGVGKDGVIAIFQGSAETGPRALGNRSILANPTNPKTLEILNGKVKYREKIRPLAPMVTLEAAKKFFHLGEGANFDNFSCYDYMVLTTKAKLDAEHRVPAVIHHDGTARIQIVRAETNPLIHQYLKELKSTIGVEVSVNTSLNVGSPIAQTPEHAIEVLYRAKGLDGIFMVSSEGECSAVWLERHAHDAYKSRMSEWLHEFGFLRSLSSEYRKTLHNDCESA
ncbi:MAG: carbamoyltransferase [Arenicella sp.]|jgi:carbamoyltransferase